MHGHGVTEHFPPISLISTLKQLQSITSSVPCAMGRWRCCASCHNHLLMPCEELGAPEPRGGIHIDETTSQCIARRSTIEEAKPHTQTEHFNEAAILLYNETQQTTSTAQ